MTAQSTPGIIAITQATPEDQHVLETWVVDGDATMERSGYTHSFTPAASNETVGYRPMFSPAGPLFVFETRTVWSSNVPIYYGVWAVSEAEISYSYVTTVTVHRLDIGSDGAIVPGWTATPGTLSGEATASLSRSSSWGGAIPAGDASCCYLAIDGPWPGFGRGLFRVDEVSTDCLAVADPYSVAIVEGAESGRFWGFQNYTGDLYQMDGFLHPDGVSSTGLDGDATVHYSTAGTLFYWEEDSRPWIGVLRAGVMEPLVSISEESAVTPRWLASGSVIIFVGDYGVTTYDPISRQVPRPYTLLGVDLSGLFPYGGGFADPFPQGGFFDGGVIIGTQTSGSPGLYAAVTDGGAATMLGKLAGSVYIDSIPGFGAFDYIGARATYRPTLSGNLSGRPLDARRFFE
jgi:hypothetical protein